jgi:hypothetical protein
MQKKGIYPNLIICGAPKCGTSSLYFWLAAHPQVGASKAKETFFFADDINRFNQGCNYIENGLEAYAAHFTHIADKPIRFEATAPYIYFANAIKGISELKEIPKLLFILREPAARLHSQYQFERYRTHRVDSSFEAYLKEPGLLAHGNYADYLQRWFSIFPAGRIKLVQFEKMMANPSKGMADIAKWLGIDAEFYSQFNFDQRNETVKIKSKGLHQWGLKLQPLIPHALQKALLPIYLKLNAGARPKAETAEIEIKKELKKQYSTANSALKNLWPELDLDAWK